MLHIKKADVLADRCTTEPFWLDIEPHAPAVFLAPRARQPGQGVVSRYTRAAVPL
jgi:hypothetical protein